MPICSGSPHDRRDPSPALPLRARCKARSNGVDRPVAWCATAKTVRPSLATSVRRGACWMRRGGSDVVQLAPHRIRFTQGIEHLSVMRLSSQGDAALVRRVLPHPGGQHHEQPQHAVHRPARAVSGQRAAGRRPSGLCWQVPTRRAHWATPSRGHSASPEPWRAFLRIVAGSRLSGTYKANPFFDATGLPVVEPTVLTAEERTRLDMVSTTV